MVATPTGIGVANETPPGQAELAPDLAWNPSFIFAPPVFALLARGRARWLLSPSEVDFALVKIRLCEFLLGRWLPSNPKTIEGPVAKTHYHGAGHAAVVH